MVVITILRWGYVHQLITFGGTTCQWFQFLVIRRNPGTGVLAPINQDIFMLSMRENYTPLTETPVHVLSISGRRIYNVFFFYTETLSLALGNLQKHVKHKSTYHIYYIYWYIWVGCVFCHSILAYTYSISPYSKWAMDIDHCHIHESQVEVYGCCHCFPMSRYPMGSPENSEPTLGLQM